VPNSLMPLSSERIMRAEIITPISQRRERAEAAPRRGSGRGPAWQYFYADRGTGEPKHILSYSRRLVSLPMTTRWLGIASLKAMPAAGRLSTSPSPSCLLPLARPRMPSGPKYFLPASATSSSAVRDAPHMFPFTLFLFYSEERFKTFQSRKAARPELRFAWRLALNAGRVEER